MISSLLTALVSGPLWVDAQIQRLVDAGMHALMRRGASKCAIRYIIGAAANVAVIATTVAWLRNGEPHGLWAYSWALLCTLLTFRIVCEERSNDAKEAAICMPVRRRLGVRLWWWCWVVLDGYALAFESQPTAVRRVVTFAMISYSLILLWSYTGQTPPRPPARKESPVLVPEVMLR